MQKTDRPFTGWHKANGSLESNCVEVGVADDGVRAVRDSEDRTGPALQFTPGQWTAFVAGVKAGEFG
jgi:hypothetical protein